MMLEQISIATRFPIAATVLLLALAACDTVDDSKSIEVQKPAQEQKSTIKKVTVTQGTNFAVALSDDASTLAMSLQGVLFTLPASGGSATAITDYYQDAREPDWSPSNNDIAYYGYANGNWDLWLVPAAGGEPKALTTDSFDDREPRYSPDGSKIAFSSDRAGNYDIWVLDLNTRELSQITSSSKNEYSPDWNPSGDSLAYATTQSRQESELRTITLSNSESQIVTKERGTINGISWRSSENLLSYQLATTNATGNNTSVKTIRVDGTEI
jgi:dipeptidyl aminopeptidase/acylaminoacyl peptidase